MSLADFVRALPKNWATAPIYAKGATLPSGRIACGKSPLGRASRENLSPELTATYIEKSPETFTAVGVYTGTRSNGLVIFDVDAVTAESRISGDPDRMEQKGREFQERVREGYRSQAQRDPQGYLVIDAKSDEDTVFSQLLNGLRQRLA